MDGRSFKDRLLDLVDTRFDDELLSKIKNLPTRANEFGYDPFGFHRDDARIGLLLARFFYRSYFRAEARGIERVPDGRVLLVSNHSGQLPFDGLCIVAANLLDRDPPRLVRAMIERFVPAMPFASYLLARWGQIIGTPENCRRLLEDEEAILVFPEGAKGISKPFSQRYQLQEFGAGFLRLALETGAPIVPVAVIGAEEQAPAMNLRPLARLLGTPSFPVMPVPPFLPILPLPSKYRIYFGELLRFEGDPDDDEGVDEAVHTVRLTLQSMIQAGIEERQHVFW